MNDRLPPREFLDRMQEMLQEEYPAFLRCYEEKPLPSLRVNPLKGSREDFLKKAPFDLKPVPWEENGFYYGKNDQPGRHPYHEAGVYYIQEVSAMAPAVYLDAKPEERVLDLCAAPGGKSGQIAASMKQRGVLVLNEIHPQRAKVLSENIERMGIANAIVINAAPEELTDRFRSFFDRILVDAPCSGEGMFRKTPEACLEWSRENVEMCAQRQEKILDSAADMLRPGGRLVYSTCTFAPQEDEGSVLRFLTKHPDFMVEPVAHPFGIAQGRADWGLRYGPATDANASIAAQLSRTLRIWPHRTSGEGHYLAVLKKTGENAYTNGSSQGKEEKGDLAGEDPAFLQFQEETLLRLPKGVGIRFGDQLYLSPEGTPSLRGLRVLRPGLHLGTLKKGRFEPSHALALYLKPQEVRHTLDLPADGKEIRDWLTGLTMPFSGGKGWYLITTDGYGIGWGKQAGGQMKNHYPRGLRKKI